jgi:hypothetical protein
MHETCSVVVALKSNIVGAACIVSQMLQRKAEEVEGKFRSRFQSTKQANSSKSNKGKSVWVRDT